jgi:hypothetical protein
MRKPIKIGDVDGGRDALPLTPLPDPFKKGRDGAPMVPLPKSPAPAKSPSPPPAEKKK